MEKEDVASFVMSKKCAKVSKNNQPLYDLYDAEMVLKNGKRKTLNLFTNSGAIDVENMPEATLKWFFYERLFGKEGIIEKQKRDKIFYLGRIGQDKDGKLIALTSDKLTDNIRTDDLFEKLYPALEKYVEKRPKKIDFKSAVTLASQKVSKGYNYVCGDIHGMYGSYLDAIDKLGDKDTLWILGDAADRGKYGIDILQDIMRRSKNTNGPKVNYLLGNHDYFIIYMMDIMKNNNLTNDEVKTVFYGLVNDTNLSFYRKEKENNPNRKEELDKKIKTCEDLKERFDLKLGKLLTSRKISYDDKRFIKFWAIENYGNHTLNDMLKMSKEEQTELYNFLTNSLIFSSQKIGKVNVALTHSAPPLIVEGDEKMGPYKKYTYNEIDNVTTGNYIINFLQTRDKYIDQAIEDKKRELIGRGVYNESSNEKIVRELDPYLQWKEKGFLTLCGHTPNREGKEVVNLERGYLRLDGGCADGGNLIMYNVEKNEVTYIKSREEAEREDEPKINKKYKEDNDR